MNRHSAHSTYPARILTALLLLFLLPLVHTTAPAPAEAQVLRAQPQLLALAAQRPDAQVSVIVQKTVKTDSVEQLVARLGGQVTRDLHIINAFSAKLPGAAVPRLAGAAGVRWVSLDAVMGEAGTKCSTCIETGNLTKAYQKSIKVDKVWNDAPGYYQGQGMTIAVVDSGVANHGDLGGRILVSQKFNSNTTYTADKYGHGTHVGGIIAGNGSQSNGNYIGVAPKANIVNIKVSDDNGMAISSDVVAGLQWIYDNRTQYNIKVVNMSLNSSVAESYHTSPLAAAAEILWFNKIVVVVSAGNNGTANLYPPANDPFVITVGAADDKNSTAITDDTMAPFSAYGTDELGNVKPDLVAPGTNIVAPLAGNSVALAQQHPGNVDSNVKYFRMSGTSVAAPMVAGAAALVLQSDPTLNPDQVKYRLKATATRDPLLWPAYDPAKAGAGYLRVDHAIDTPTTESANYGIPASQLLWSGTTPITWGTVNWNTVNWNTVNWNTVNWNTVNWNTVNWNSTYWPNP
jgi:serine protease AprX